jgi:radical SAM protein with 4Fe4S-binding SPASM domain
LNDLKLNEMKIEVTYTCTLSCVHCSSDANPGNQLSMSKKKCIEIIDSALSIGVKEITFSGGEPFIWEGLVEAVAHSKNKGLVSNIYTTGNCDNLDKLMKKLKTVGVDKLIFSLYSDNESEHNRVTRKADSFINTVKAIELAQSYKIYTELHFVALASNYKKLVNIAEMAQANGVKRVSVLRFVPQGRGQLISNYDTLNKSQNLELKKIIIDLRNKGFDIRTGSPFNVLLLNTDPKCMAAQDRLVIGPDLNIYPCDAFKQISYKSISPSDEYSNLNKHTIAECWKQSKYFELVRNAILSTPSEPCHSCKNNKRCLAGCLAQKYLYYSALNKNPDPACLIGA